jgi:DNA-binding NarL/FixJ family response regulator
MKVIPRALHVVSPLDGREEPKGPTRHSRHANGFPLSRSELAVLDDAANGLTVNESAAFRWKSSDTIKTQRRAILHKLGARNMAQAVGMTNNRQTIGGACNGAGPMPVVPNPA